MPPRALLPTLLLLAPAARADIPPAGRQECLDLLSGDPCGPRDDAGAPRGICRLVTCWQVAGDDDQGSPSPFTCLRCRPRDAPPAEEQEQRRDDRVLRVVQRGDDGPLREPALRRRRDEERREAARAIREAQERGLALGATLAGGSALVVAAVVLLLRRRGSTPARS